MTDAEAWNKYPEDRWVYDKIDIAVRYGVDCGSGCYMPIPTSNKYVVKPIINLDGCSIGSRIVENLEGFTVPDNSGWFEYLEGEHWTVDFRRVGDGWESENFFYGVKDHTKFLRWFYSNDIPDVNFGLVLSKIKQAPIVNFEGIGDKVIEVHLRGNTDPVQWDEFVPVWKGYDYRFYEEQPDVWKYIDDKEDHPGRVGFFVRNYNERL